MADHPHRRAPRLGTGAVRAAGCPPKAALLDERGLAIPPGLVVPPDMAPDDHVIEDVRDLVRGWPQRVIAVRSAFGAEDQVGVAHAGRFETVLDISADDPHQIVMAIDKVRASAQALDDTIDPGFRTDVLIMAQVPALVSGVVFTERTFEDDLVNLADGLADDLVSGRTAGSRVVLPKLRRGERPAGALKPWQQRLQRLLRDVRQVYGEADWDIEWADDGHECWLIQIRPITAPPRRDEAFTIANHKEILPELPSNLMTSLILGASDDLMGFYRRVDPTLPIDRPYIEVFEGRPYVNLSLLTDVLRALGLPTALLADSMGGEVEITEPIRPLRAASRAPAYLRLARGQLTSVPAAQKTGRALIDEAIAIGAEDDLTFGRILDQAHHTYVRIVETMSSLASNMALPVGLLRRAGTLSEHGASQRTAATRMVDDLAPVAELLEAGHSVDDDNVRTALDRWLCQHGHRGMYESDLAQPRFADDLAPILAMAAMGTARRRETTSPETTTARRSPKGWLTLPLWKAAAPAMAAREQFRSDAMRAFGHLRFALLSVAGRAVTDGRLPRADGIWLLTVDELRAMDDGESFAEKDLAEREETRERWSALSLPDLLHRFDDLHAVPETSSDGPKSTFRGIPLTGGKVRGVALPASTPPRELPPDAQTSTVLVARSIDAGWVPTLSQVAAVVVAIGGDLSHGSIIVRELGLPAATNFGEDLMQIEAGTTVDVDADRGVVTIVD